MAGASSIVLTVITELFDGMKSVSFPTTKAVLVMTPVDVGTTVRVMVAEVFAFRLPKAQATTPPDTPQLPWLGRAETKLTVGDNKFVRFKAVAVEGPALATVIL